MTLARADDVVAVGELAGAGVAGDVHLGVALVHDVGAPAGEGVDDAGRSRSRCRGSASWPSARCRPRPIRIGWSRLAIRASAAIGSPWDPVQIRVIWSSGSSSSSLRSTTRPSGTVGSPGRGRCPCCAPWSGRRRRPCGRGACAASSTCWMRCTWLAKLDTMIRRGAVRNTSSIAGARSRSDVVNPGTSALVESMRKRSTPSSPSRAKARRSVIRWSSGNWSILKSPVCSTSAGPGADRDGEPVGDGVVDRDELAVERAEASCRSPSATSTRDRLDPVLLELGRR